MLTGKGFFFADSRYRFPNQRPHPYSRPQRQPRSSSKSESEVVLTDTVRAIFSQNPAIRYLAIIFLAGI
jgi:hypothetical protein